MALGIVKTYLGLPFSPINVVRGQFVRGQLVCGQFVAVSCCGPVGDVVILGKQRGEQRILTAFHF